MYERIGRVTAYTGGLGIVYVAIEHIPAMRGSLRAFILLWLLLVLSEVTEREGLRKFLVWTGAVLAVVLIPWGSSKLWGAAVTATIGSAIMTNAQRTSRERLMRGLGAAVILWGISVVPGLADVKDVFLYAGAASLGAYTVAEYAKSFEWSYKADASIVPAGLLGALTGLYMDFSGKLLREYPSIAFYGKWLSLVGAVTVAAAWVYSLIPEESPERTITEGSLEGPSTWGEEAVRDFILTGRKVSLISYIAHYGRDALSTREDLERVLTKIEEYRETRMPKLVPPWLKRAHARREVERRKKLVEEVLKEIDLLIKGDGE